ncbi:MAG TPA: DUF3311 domain-containing protein [Marmoricola sp.]|nr:DUF3311 domain-containing protein [Marmoricola sp.]
MTNGAGGRGRDGVPPTNYSLLVAAGVLLVIPVVALMWVSSYARETPKLGPFPFFFWYQFAWVIVCALMTYGAYRLVLAARKQPPPPVGPPGSEGRRRHDRTPMDGEQ